MRVIVYEMKDGSEEVFNLLTKEDEQHERAQAERELHSRDSQVVGYHFDYRPLMDVARANGHIA
jgi:D-lyxose ketol-isomerase